MLSSKGCTTVILQSVVASKTSVPDFFSLKEPHCILNHNMDILRLKIVMVLLDLDMHAWDGLRRLIHLRLLTCVFSRIRSNYLSFV
jgi:hypothetical protein